MKNTPLNMLEMAEANPPALIITDLMLPKFHGYEVIRKLRAFPATAKVPIVVLSAKVFTPDRRKALELGANEFLEKPFNVDELSAVIDKYCARTTPESSAAPPETRIPAVGRAA
jgi:DNA-binding response OmpR family regulator